MYQYSYSEILADSAADSRAEERRALDLAATLLQNAEKSAPGSAEEKRALDFTMQLWGIFVRSLSSSDNDLPEQLRCDLMSIGLGVMAEANRIDQGQSRDLASLADICRIIRDGLN